MEGEVPSVNETDRIKENVRTGDHASSFWTFLPKRNNAGGMTFQMKVPKYSAAYKSEKIQQHYIVSISIRYLGICILSTGEDGT